MQCVLVGLHVRTMIVGGKSTHGIADSYKQTALNTDTLLYAMGVSLCNRELDENV